MNESILNTVRNEVEKRGLTHQELADQLNMPRSQVTRMLNGKSGRIPDGWAALLHALGLEVVAKRTGGRRG
ncbi:helix-turn-helix transcriptional regulator [Deinococcus sp. 23YEL01]|jgi:transcriptional regulator with XRE-family HTH domain|uniref:helix-turn-helix domain-containing protein n=1 Tax=Deinococcus sp. 23YEL01 TaxID=2745871 RepID=UPI001E3ADF39|nr:helix-turn-helix transcriptional regulator [Deinococcus sp. 23YEL01]MCD0169663.1 helix-turn-helix domain-containing protein [Deinococcus sp. 23YEL01]